MELPRFRRDNSWIESLGRDVALAVALVAILVVMERMNDWITDSMAPAQIWRQFFNVFRLLVVGQLTAVFVIFAGRYALPEAGVWRWLGLVALVTVACVLGWQVLVQWRAIGWPHRPLPPFVAIMFQHQLAVTAVLIAGLHEFLRISRRAAGALHQAQLRRIAIEGDLAEGRLQVLQAQIEPHFLFNSLANVRRLLRIDAPAGQAMLTDLMRYLEVALPRMRDDHSTLGREPSSIRAFLAVHQVRMGDRLRRDRHSGPRSAQGAADDAADAGRERAQARAQPHARRRLDARRARQIRRPPRAQRRRHRARPRSGQRRRAPAWRTSARGCKAPMDAPAALSAALERAARRRRRDRPAER